MSNIVSTIRKFTTMESFALPASDETIEKAEKELNLKFANDYREYVSAFGAIWSEKITVSGIIDGDKDFGVVELTNRLRPLYSPQTPHSFYVIEDVGVDGLVIWQDKNSAIYQSIPGSEPFRIHDNLSGFLEYVMQG